MINSRADYRFVAGDINRVAIDGGIMPVRPQAAKKVLRGEDICFLAEAHQQRTDLWDQSGMKMSKADYSSGYPVYVTVSSPGQVFPFSRNLSIQQLRTVAGFHEADRAKTPGQQIQEVKPFFAARKPQSMSGPLTQQLYDDMLAELQDFRQLQPLAMPAASLNGSVLKQSEIEDMFADNSLFRLPCCGNTNMEAGYGVGTYPDTDYNREGSWQSILIDGSTFIYWNISQKTQDLSSTYFVEGWPSASLNLASVADNGDIDSAEYWCVIAMNAEFYHSGTWLWLGKLGDLALDNGVWKMERSSAQWNSLLSQLYTQVTGIQLFHSLATTYDHLFADMTIYAPFVVVNPKNRFAW